VTEVATAAPEPGWRGIGELARLVGAYCWVEERVFEVTGAWAARPADDAPGPSLRVWCAAASRRHGELAQAWADRLPVRAGVDPTALVTAPDATLARALDRLAVVPDDRAGLTMLVGTVLPRLAAAYGAHLGAASPVCEAPVVEVLVRAGRALAGEIEDGGRLLARLPGGPVRAGQEAQELGTALERSFGAAGVSPAVRPS